MQNLENILVENNNFFNCLEKLKKNEIIAYPTESMYGLGCNPDSKIAVQKLIKLKKRSKSMPFIIIAEKFEHLNPYIMYNLISEKHKIALFNSWPGAITWLIPANPNVPKWLIGEDFTVAVRIIDHSYTKLLCKYFKKPIISTSANISGKAPCMNSKQVSLLFGKSIYILEGKIGKRKYPSEIRDLTTGIRLR